MPSIVKTKPVATLGTGLTVSEAVVAYLAAHHVIPPLLAPYAALVVAALLALAIHELVSPYSKVKGVLERDGLLSDADFTRIEALVAEYTGADLAPVSSVPAIEPPPTAHAG
jgi:hypothetical protein